jgi:tetratricopeptide (TPR) repeat protein
MVWMAVVAMGEIKETPDEAVNAFARGYGLVWRYEPQKAIEAFDEAVEADPSYANAYYERGNAHLSLAFDNVGLDPAAAQAELTSGADDFEEARRAGKDDKNVNWNLGFVYYLTGDFDKAIEAGERALDEDPTLFPVACNNGLTHLAAGRLEEARDNYDSAIDAVIKEVAVAKRADREPPSSLWLYLHLCAADLESLRARLVLDPRPWTQAPPRDLVKDSEDMRREVDRLLTEVKDQLIALEYTGSPPGAEATAEASPFQFGLARLDANGDPVYDDEGFQVYDPEPDATFPFDTKEVNVLFDYEGMVDGQAQNWKIYIDGDEETALRIDTDWGLGESGGAVLPISYEFSSTFLLRSGEYTVELYIDNRLIQRGTFTIK